MIPLKTPVPIPGEGKAIRITPTSDSAVLRRVLIGYRATADAFVPAESPAQAESVQLNACVSIFEADGNVFRGSATDAAHYPAHTVYTGAGGTLTGAVAHWDEAGARTIYLLWEQGMTMLRDDLYGRVSGMVGGKCMTLHRERLFVGAGSTLSYSAPLKPTTFSLDAEDTGKFSLSGEGGDILALLSFKGDLYCFRRYELLRIRADADDLNFRLERLPFDGREIAEGSVALCGSYFAFRTDRGLIVFEGSGCKLALETAAGLVYGAGCGRSGRYYMTVEHGDKAGILVYDHAGAPYFLDVAAEQLVGGRDGVYFVHGSLLYCLKEQETETTRQILLTVDLGGASPRYVAGVTVIGSGRFTCRLQTEEGEETVTALAGKRAALGRRLRGETLSLTLTAAEKGAVEAIHLFLREGTK